MNQNKFNFASDVVLFFLSEGTPLNSSTVFIELGVIVNAKIETSTGRNVHLLCCVLDDCRNSLMTSPQSRKVVL